MAGFSPFTLCRRSKECVWNYRLRVYAYVVVPEHLHLLVNKLERTRKHGARRDLTNNLQTADKSRSLSRAK
jgi:hypothetical protein